MIMSSKLTSTILRRVRNVMRLCALCVLPLGLVHCDGDLVADGDVVAPELSSVSAQLMEEPSTAILLMDPGAMETYVSAEVASGSMTREEGDGLRQRFHAPRIARLRVAVQAGRITREEAETRLRAMRAQLSRDRASRSDGDYDLDQLERRIRGAIAGGSLSDAEAERWPGVLRRARAMEAEINAAVASGRVTAQQGAARLQAGLRALLARGRSGTDSTRTRTGTRTP